MFASSGNHKKMALKLHKQFGHPNAHKLIKLLCNANMSSNEIEKEIKAFTASCDVCIRLQKPVPRPTVSIPLATKFNETIAIDLKIWGKVHFMVIVDTATRLC